MSGKTKSLTVSNAKRISSDEVPEVKELEAIIDEITALKADNPDVFARLRDLGERYNSALELAEKVVRAKEVTCGPFENFSTVVIYDAEKMYDELGHDLYFEIGGTTEQRTVYNVQKDRVEAAIAAKKISPESLDEFRTVQRKYKKPGGFVLP